MTSHTRARKVTCKSYESNHMNMTRPVGANRDFVFNRIPHICGLTVHCIDAVLDHAKTAVTGNMDPTFGSVLERPRDDQDLLDFVWITDNRSKNGNHDGRCW